MNVHKVEKLTSEKWLNLYAANFENNGHAGRWVFASRQTQPVVDRRADAVIIVPILHAPPAPPRLVVIKEFRVPVDGWVYAFPAGLLEAGENIEESTRRELMEETGLTVTRFKQISPILFSSAGLSDESVLMVFVDAVAMPGAKASLEGSEELEVELLDHKGVCALCDNSAQLMDARLWTTLFMYKQMGRLE